MSIFTVKFRINPYQVEF